MPVSADSYGIIEFIIRIEHRVEALHVVVHIRVMQRGGDGVCCFIENALSLFGQRLPLAGRLLEAEIAVGGCAHAVHQNADAALMTGGVYIVKGHNVHAEAFEIA